MEVSITVILKEARGFDRSFQLMYQPSPIWTQNEDCISKDNTKIGFDLNGRFEELLKYCQDKGHRISDEKECIVAYRKELKNYSPTEIKGLINDIERNGFKYHVVEY